MMALLVAAVGSGAFMIVNSSMNLEDKSVNKNSYRYFPKCKKLGETFAHPPEQVVGQA
jgi:hypothetical protein